MKHHWNGITVAIASLFLTTLNLETAQAYTFGQQEVDQSKFVAIAVPFAEGKLHNLIILEQISDSQSCWQEKNDQPGVIDPLLLKFDFSGICGRSTDSNGYSIRQAGQDLALNYRLSVVKRKGHLELMGYPSKNPQAPQLKLGQTTSTTDGFLKIELLPGWRFTKRTYNGKTLGHIYITRDQAPNIGSETLAEAPADAVPPLSQDSKPETDDLQPLDQKPTPNPAKIEHPVPIPLPKRTQPTPSKTSTISDPQAREALTRLITSPIEIPVPAPNSSSNLKPESAIPYSRKPSNETAISPSKHLPSDPLQNPAPSQHPNIAAPRPETDSDLPVLEGENPDALPKPQQYQQQSRPSTTRKRKTLIKLASKPPLSRKLFSRPVQIPVPPIKTFSKPSPGFKTRPVNAPGRYLPTSKGILPVPQGEVPLGRFNPDSDIYAANQDASRASQLAAVSRTGNPPPPPLDARSRLRYRVVVKVANASQHKKIKALVPDAFRSSYKGRSVLQVGAYESQIEANERLDKLSFEGIQGILEVR